MQDPTVPGAVTPGSAAPPSNGATPTPGQPPAGNGAVNAETQREEMQKMMAGMLKAMLSREFKKGLAEALTPEALAPVIEKHLEKLAEQADSAAPQPPAGGKQQETPQANQEVAELRKKFDAEMAAVKAQLDGEKKAAQAALAAAKQTRIAAEVKRRIEGEWGANFPYADMLAKELVGRVDEVNGQYTWKNQVPAGDGTHYDDVKPLDEGFAAWKAGDGKRYAPQRPSNLPPAGMPFGNAFSPPPNGNGQHPVGLAPRMPDGRSNPFVEIAKHMAGPESAVQPGNSFAPVTGK